MRFYKQKFDTPLGVMLGVMSNESLYFLAFEDWKGQERQFKKFGVDIEVRKSTISRQLAGELKGYFAGELTTFQTPVKYNGTPFQQQVWQAVITLHQLSAILVPRWL